MKKRVCFSVAYLFFWVVLFILYRGLFLLYHHNLTARLPIRLVVGVFLHGARLDLSFASYLAVIPFLFIVLSVIVPSRITAALIKYYTVVCIVLATFISVSDFELFGEWGYRMDSSVLMYLATPREALASAGSSPLFLLIMYFFVLSLAACFFYLKTVHSLFDHRDKPGILTAPLFVFLTAALIIPIRGGFQLAPVNQSSAYFSDSDFANQVALNVHWGFFYSLRSKSYDTTNPYKSMEDAAAEAIVGRFYRSGSGKPTPRVVNSGRPNVILIIWESLTAKAVSSLGGVEGVTPNFDRLCREGILFSRCYANADRSAGGIVALLSGYPDLPKQRIIKMPAKTANLPSLARCFNEAGYTSSFYHGGELEFANIRSYLRNEKFSWLIGKDSFAAKDWNSKWGAHDHVVLGKLLDDLDREKGPFFSVIFTLSSHEPFEIPGQEKNEIERINKIDKMKKQNPVNPVKKNDESGEIDTLFLNSLRYTDRSVADFIGQAKSKPWYRDTLIIIIADHGHNRPGNSQRYDPAKYHIPMLWLGGALCVRDTVITRICGQTDLAATLLNQVKIDSKDFTWSRDVLNPDTPSGVFYTFNDGVGYIDDRGCLLYDHTGQTFFEFQVSGFRFQVDTTLIRDDEAIRSPSDADSLRISLARAYLQDVYRDFLKR